jgi:hypothetical protein
MLTYSQIEAIHEAIRECEESELVIVDARFNTFASAGVNLCFAKIRAALAGETRCTHCPSPAGGPHKMSCALNKDRETLAGETATVPNAIAERDAKLSTVMSIVQEMATERDKLVDCGYPDDLTEYIDKLRDALSGETNPVPFSPEGLAAVDELKERLGGDWSKRDDHTRTN